MTQQFTKNLRLSYDDCSDRLLEALLDNQGMENLVALAAELLGNPVAVGTTRLTVLYASKNMPTNVPMSKPGTIPPYFSTDKEFIQYIESAYYSDTPVLTREQYGGYRTLLMRLTLQGQIAGYMSIFFYNSLYSPEIEPLAVLVRQAIECELARHASLLSLPLTAPEALLTNLLNGKTDDLTGNADAITRLGLNKQTTFYMMLFHMIGFSGSNAPGSDIKNELQKITDAQVSIYHEKSIVLLKQGSIRDFLRDFLRDSPCSRTLSAFMKENGLCGGISYGIRQILDIPGAFHQAQKALSHAKQQGVAALIPYDYVVIPDFVKNTMNKHRLNYKLPELKTIENYDKAHGTDFRKVFSTYIEQGKNASLTAACTGLSKSSVYRILDRIRQMTGLDFDQNEHLFAIYLGIKIEDYT